MITGKETEFNGFSGKTPVFLKNLKANNNRPWFEAHRQDYHKYLLEPLRNLVTDMGEFMLTIDPFFEISPGIDKTISRIYRDTRFSRDKSPFKSSLWITFKRPDKNWQDDPTYFFEITPDSYRYGMGFYSASKNTMDRFREKIDKKQKDFLKAISFFSEQQIFVIEGEKYKRILDSNMPEYLRRTGAREGISSWFATGRSIIAFRTWAYRIAANHVINMKKRRSEQDVTNFECYGIALDEIPEMSLSDRDCRPVDMQILVEEAKISCMTAMLLCLDREQRLIYILRDIFEISYSIGSRILEISEVNFRQKLSRTRKKLYDFMNDKCSLINRNNPCRCVRKTKGFIRSGIVDPYKLKFNENYLKKVKDVSKERSRELDSLVDSDYASLFREHPFQNPPDFVKKLHDILHGEKFKNIFDFNNS